MTFEITMPALSPTMEEGSIAKWLVQVGDFVTTGQPVVEIETDKATLEVEAIEDGVVSKILAETGATGIKVNQAIAILVAPDQDQIDVENNEAVEHPRAHTMAVSGATAKTEHALALPVGTSSSTSTSERTLKASPLAKRLAKLNGIELSSIRGSGPRGRIVARDVERAESGLMAKSVSFPPGTSPDSALFSQTLDDRVFDPSSYDLQPLDGMRKTIARRLSESFMQVPHFPLTLELGLDALLKARNSMNEVVAEGEKISINDMLIKASAIALAKVPECNASYTDSGIAYHREPHVSVAVAIDGGLVTPVIRNARLKGLAEISREMKDLAARARSRALKPEEYTGGTFSISNLGMFGIKSFASIINPPQGMILSIGSAEKRPYVGADGDIRVRTAMSVTLTCDHRVIGGAEAASWLQAFRTYVETPEAMWL